MEENKKVYNVFSFRDDMNKKDEYTLGHSDRVSEYAALLGKKLGLSEENINTLKIGGLYHDIGKLNMSDSILKKESKLNDDEFANMKKHVIDGVNLVSSSNNYEKIMPIIEYHHEKYDGTGYPYNLKGEQIPYFARITSVVDSFDAMTSSRPYRDALPIDVARAELEKGAGTQFDPEIIKQFLDIIDNNYDEIKRIKEKYK